MRLCVAGALALFSTVAMGCSPPGGLGLDEPNGARLFYETCSNCHASDARGTDRGPDLTFQASTMEIEEVVDVILDGSGAMAPVELTVEEADAVALYLVETFL